MLGYPSTLVLAGKLAGQVRSIDGAELSSLYGDYATVSSEVRQYLEGYERIFIFSAQGKNAFIENIQHCHPGAFHLRTFPSAQQHVIDFQLAQLAQAGFVTASSVPQLRVSDHDLNRAGHYQLSHACDAAAGLLIAVHAGSGGRHKCWPLESFVAVLHWLHGETHAGYLIVQGPAEEKTAGELQEGLAGLPHTIVANLDLPLVAALLSRCALCIGNDSGMTHVAAALGVPTVAVFGPTDPAVWGPRGASVSIVRQLDAEGQWRWPEPEAVFESARMLLAVDKERLLK